MMEMKLIEEVSRDDGDMGEEIKLIYRGRAARFQVGGESCTILGGGRCSSAHEVIKFSQISTHVLFLCFTPQVFRFQSFYLSPSNPR